MKTRPSLTCVITGVVLIGCAPEATAADPASQNSKHSSERPAKTAEGWPILKKGMTAEEIIKAIGKPTNIRPMEVKEGAAEVWVYRREIGRRTEQREVGQAEMPAFVGTGMGSGIGTVYVPTYGTEQIVDTQVSSLLMFEGKFVAATQKVERERRLD